MYARPPWFVRGFSALLAIVFSLSALIAVPAEPVAASGRQETLFRATFEGETVGPLTIDLEVETGVVVADEGTVAIASTGDSLGLELDGSGGQATALLQWSNYNGPLPGLPPPAVHVTIEGVFTADATTAEGATFGILAGNTFFELFTFDAAGELTRDGVAIGLEYDADEDVELDARVLFPGGSDGTVQIKLASGGSQRTIVVPIGSSFDAATLNQLRFRAPNGSGVFTADDLKVNFKRGEVDDDPPAEIEIDDDTVEQSLELINGVVFVNLIVLIANGENGGKTRGTFLVVDLDDLEELDLADISFLEGIGFVSSIRDGNLYIGLGQNNMLYGNSKIKIKIRLKVKDGVANVRVDIRMRLQYRDTGGSRDIALIPVPVLIPVLVGGVLPPISSTGPISGTNPISGTVPVSGTVNVPRLEVSRIDIRFRATWEQRGGLAIFGLPLTEPITTSDGLVVQYFERARLEYHPDDDGTGFIILLGRLAAELGYATPPVAAPTDPAEIVWYFPATGHLITTQFRTFWRGSGGLLLFGLPISEPREENGLLVQYFERARLELHPDLAGTPYAIQIGLLGVNALSVENDDDDDDDD